MFKIGDLAVYPAQGVGVIEAIENREVGGSKQLFYIMKIMGNGMKIMIPMDSAKSVGLREVILETEIPKVYAILRNKDVTIDKQTWNKRYREYLEKIKTGSVFEIARVLRDLFHSEKRQKPLLRGEENDGYGEEPPHQGDLGGEQCRGDQDRRGSEDHLYRAMMPGGAFERIAPRI